MRHRARAARAAATGASARVAALAVLAALLLPGAPATAQTQAAAPSTPATSAAAPAPKADLVDLEDEIMCVTCRVPLSIAEGAQPDSQRAFIRELIAEGRSKAEIKRALVAEYGPDVLALPDESGFGITAYAIPLALGALVVGGLALLVPRWRRRGTQAANAAPGEASAASELSDADAARLDEDLARYDA